MLQVFLSSWTRSLYGPLVLLAALFSGIVACGEEQAVRQGEPSSAMSTESQQQAVVEQAQVVDQTEPVDQTQVADQTQEAQQAIAAEQPRPAAEQNRATSQAGDEASPTDAVTAVQSEPSASDSQSTSTSNRPGNSDAETSQGRLDGSDEARESDAREDGASQPEAELAGDEQADHDQAHLAQPPVATAANQPDDASKAESASEDLTRQVGPGGVDGSGQGEPPEPDAPPTGKPSTPSSGGPTGKGTAYSWQDGDETRTVWTEDAPGSSSGLNSPQGDVGGAAGAQGTSVEPGADDPVFYDDAGSPMTLPGGVLIDLDPEWDQARINQFFAEHSIDRSKVRERLIRQNAFFVETGPGFASLNLANHLAGQEGVLSSSPNWQTEAVVR